MRLIDADKLLDDMKKELEKAVNEENMDKAECMVIMTAAIALKDFVNRQPTAYDVDKVIKQLEERLFSAEVYNDDLDGCDINDLLCMGDVIEIVEAGEIDEEIKS